MSTAKQVDNGRLMRGGRITAGSQRRARSEQTELNLLRAATWLFSERGFHGTGIRDIADAAGAAVSALYYYASSKDELLLAVMRRSLGMLVSGGEEAIRDRTDPAERLAALITVHVVFHARNPRAARVTDGEVRALSGKDRTDILRHRDAYEAVWTATLRAGVADGSFVDRGDVARLALLEMLNGVAHWYRPRGQLSVPQLCERFADMGLALMGASRHGRTLTAADVRLPDTQMLLDRVELAIEPRRKPPGL
ncbi:TetR/AcrR family transcriptional regulator [Micromonospora sp. CPCC 205371]|nr:TetR/AcrR family transcriptional regulator [Micromonospora sp. CPCC 205371]